MAKKPIYKCVLVTITGVCQGRDLGGMCLHGIMVAADHPSVGHGHEFMSSPIEHISFVDRICVTKNSVYHW